MSIVVTGATGNIGHELTRLLAEAGEDVTAIARNPDKLAPQVREKVKVQAGDLNDREFVLRATAGAVALFWLTPPNFGVSDVVAYYREMGEIAAAAIQANGIGHVVFISSVGAQDPDAGNISGAGYQERILGEAAPNLTVLRNGFFMENFLMQAQSLKQEGAFYAVVSPDTPIPMVATRDIAAVAARKLRDRSWTGHKILGVQGPEDLTSAQAADILTDVLGKPIRYIRITEEQARDFALGIGASPGAAAAFARMEAAMDRPGFVAEPRTPETTTPTTLREWATEVLKPALAG